MGRVKTLLPEQTDPLDELLRAPEPSAEPTVSEAWQAAIALRMCARLVGSERPKRAATLVRVAAWLEAF